MAGTPAQKFFPQIDPNIARNIALHIQNFYAGLNDHDQAIVTLKTQFDSLSKTTTLAGTSTITTITTNTNLDFPGLGTVNDQSGSTAYTLQASDNGILLIVSDASPVAVSLNSSLMSPYFFFITNFGPGTATLTPGSGNINGSGTFTLLSQYTSIVVFDGSNWWATVSPIVPVFAPAEIPSGVIDGVNTVFTLTQAPNPPLGLPLYQNGLFQNQIGGVDYTLSGNTITMTVAPPLLPNPAVLLTGPYQY